MEKLTAKERILGADNKEASKESAEIVFSFAAKFEVRNEKGGQTSIIGGNLLKNILPANFKEKILSGEKNITYNGIVINRIVEKFKADANEGKNDTQSGARKTQRSKRKHAK